MIEKKNTNITINNQQCPIIFYPIDNDDKSSISFYKDNGYMVKTISYNGNAQCFALIPVETQEQAKRINQELNCFYLQEKNAMQLKMDNEISFDEITRNCYKD